VKKLTGWVRCGSPLGDTLALLRTGNGLAFCARYLRARQQGANRQYALSVASYHRWTYP